MATTPKNLYRGKMRANWTVQTGGLTGTTPSQAFLGASNLLMEFGVVALPSAPGSVTANNVTASNAALDGSTWTQRTVTAPSTLPSGYANWIPLACNNVYGSGLYMTVAPNTNAVAVYYASGAASDSAAWVVFNPATLPALNWSSIVYHRYDGPSGSGPYVANWVLFAKGTNQCYVSSDQGLTWAAKTLPATANWAAAASASPTYSGSTAVFTASNTIVVITTGANTTARSTDGGVTWVAGGNLPGSNLNWQTVLWLPQDSMVAIASGTTTNAVTSNGSTAGTTWSAGTCISGNWTASGTTARRYYSGSNGTAGYAEAVAVEYGTARTMYCQSASNWVLGPALPATANWSALLLDQNRGAYVAVANGSTNAAFCTDPSAASATWTASVNSSAAGWSLLYQSAINPNQGAVALAGDGSNALSNLYYANTTAPYTWVSRGNFFVGSVSLSGMGYGNGTYLITSNSQYTWNGSNIASTTSSSWALTSTNLTSWTWRSLPVAGAWTSVAYGSVGGTIPTFVMAQPNTTSTTVLQSVDNGVTWTSRTLPVSGTWKVLFVNNLFVALNVGQAGFTQILTSTDGATWTARTTPTPGASSYWNSITYGNGIFVAVAYSGGLTMTSTDGATWNSAGSTGVNNQTVVFGGGQFVAISSAGSPIATSTDAVSWTPRYQSGYSNSILNGFYLNSKFVFPGISQGGVTGGVEDTTNVILYTVPAGTVTILTDVVLVGTGYVTVRVAGEELVSWQSLSTTPTQYNFRQVLNPGDQIVAYSSSTAMTAHFNGVEITS